MYELSLPINPLDAEAEFQYFIFIGAKWRRCNQKEYDENGQ
jgi:hypothetical protein